MDKLPRRPDLQVPEPLRGSDPDSFPQHTVTTRLPAIARRVLQSRDWHNQAYDRLQALMDEMPSGRLRTLDDPYAPDSPGWEKYLSPYRESTWLEVPWFVAETYFYRRILEATGFFQDGPGCQLDPFLVEKQQEYHTIFDQSSILCQQLDDWSEPESPTRIQQQISGLFRTNIWGNQADRSMWPAGADGGGPSALAEGQPDEHLLVDHTHQIAAYLSHRVAPLRRLDVILDNGGIELAFDLSLVDFLLTRSLAMEIRLHAKPHPTFVSDVTIPDIHATIDHLATAPEACVRELAARLSSYLQDKKLHLVTNYYWTSPLSGWEMPEELWLDLRQSDLIISKGDANYRRWLGDRHWSHTSPIEAILSYFPAPVLMLRVLKSNIIAGLPGGVSAKMDLLDPQWLHNGKWGIIQLARLPSAMMGDFNPAGN